MDDHVIGKVGFVRWPPAYSAPAHRSRPLISNHPSPRQAGFDRFTDLAFVVAIVLTIMAVFWIGPANALAVLAEAF